MIHVDETDPVGEIEQTFPYRDVTIKRGTDAKELYDLITEVGRGKFGTVYKCCEKTTGLQFAGKFIPIPKRDDRRNVEREVDIMNKLQHPRIIQLYDAYEFGKMMCVVLELIDGGELFERVIDDDFILTEKACVIFVRQVCEAIEFVHRNYIIHLDLKPENILCLTREGNRIKIIDFGLARKFDPEKKLQVLFGTPEFVAPEVVNFDTITFGTDMWSIGVICYVLLSGLSPFMGETDIETMANVTIAKYDFEDDAFADVSEDAIDFISKLLVKDSGSRMTATECLQHKWLRKKPIRPQLAPKPVTVPPPKLKARTQSPTEELDQTKDNLKQFVERWSEHPNSPYIFDTGTQYIVPVIDLQNDTEEQLLQDKQRIAQQDVSNLSSRDYIKIQNGTSAGCSPSPCGSLTSSQDMLERDKSIDDFVNTEQQSPTASIITTVMPTNGSADEINHIITDNGINNDDSNNQINQQTDEGSNDKDLRNYLHSFDRRNSDSSYVLKQNSLKEKFNLADEIKKLSDHLLMLSSINTDLKNNVQINNEKNANGNEDILNEIINKNLTNGNGNYERLADDKTTSVELNNNNVEKPDIKEKPEDLPTTHRSKLSECFNRSVSIPAIVKITDPIRSPVNISPKFKTSSSLTEKRPPGVGGIIGNGHIGKIDNKIHNTFNRSNSFSATKSNGMNGTTTTTSISDNKFSSTSTSTFYSTKTTSTSSTTSSTSSFGAKLLPTKLITNGNNINKIKIDEKFEKQQNGFGDNLPGNRRSENITIKRNGSLRSPSDINGIHNNSFYGGAPWPITNRRTKFRINQMSRDVPVCSPNTHQTFFMEEAANATKDCLLHLLEKYNEGREFKNGNTNGRHQSISEWGLADNLEYRSMNSINTFFQRHATTGSTVKQIQNKIEGKK